MKTSHLLIIAYLIFLTTGLARAQQFNFGIQAGLVGADIRLSEVPPEMHQYGDPDWFDPMISYSINAFLGYEGKSMIGFSAEPGYILKGGIAKWGNDNPDDDSRMQLGYLQLPVLAGIHITEKFSASAGPELAYMISAKAKSDYGENKVYDLYDNHFELAAIAGINYAFTMHIQAGVKYSHGLTNTSKIILTDQAGNVVGRVKEFNHYLQLWLRYII